MSKKLIIFDCDGTLVDSEVIATQVFPAYWATHGVYFSEEEFKEKFIGKGINAPINKEIFAKMPPHAREEGDELLDKALKESLKPVQGMVDLLSSLKGPLCVASNSSLSYVKEALKTTKIESFFGSNVFSAEQVSHPKPEPDLFLYAAETLGMNPESCIVVEDSPSGVMAAKKAKMKVIAFAGAGHFIPKLEENLKKVGPDYFYSSLPELKEILNSLIKS